MTWNYRIIKYDLDKGVYYRVHEVFYDEKGRIEFYSEDPIFAQGNSKEELINELKLMLKDAQKSKILSMKKLDEYFEKKRKKKIV